MRTAAALFSSMSSSIGAAAAASVASNPNSSSGSTGGSLPLNNPSSFNADLLLHNPGSNSNNHFHTFSHLQPINLDSSLANSLFGSSSSGRQQQQQRNLLANTPPSFNLLGGSGPQQSAAAGFYPRGSNPGNNNLNGLLLSGSGGVGGKADPSCFGRPPYTDHNNWLEQGHSSGSTIINESDFPSLGVRWSPSSFGGGGSISSVGLGVGGDGSSTSVPLNYGSVAGSSPLTPGGGGGMGPLGHQVSLHNALFNREAGSGLHGVMSRPYANLIRDGNSLSAQNEFRIQNEDFPALPGAVNHSSSGQQPQQQANSNINSSGMSAAQNLKNLDQLSADLISSSANSSEQQSRFSVSTTEAMQAEVKPGIQTHPDGLVTQIPPNMLNDQYGMAGLLTFLRTIESDPSPPIALALGYDLTNLGLNLNSSKRNLYQTFGGPWADFPCRIQDLDVKVPEEYLTNATIRDKLPNIKLNKLGDDVLFYLFYNCPGEVYQVAAASELYQRDWRFHKVDRVWLTRSPFVNQREHTGSAEKSSYNVFDPIQWRKIPKDMVLEYKLLEGRPCAPVAAPTPATSNLNNHTNNSTAQHGLNPSAPTPLGVGPTTYAPPPTLSNNNGNSNNNMTSNNVPGVSNSMGDGEARK